jgi:glycosyltransferase involved in cell wall biosynthesis
MKFNQPYTKMNDAAVKRLLLVVPVYASYRAFLKGLAAWLTKRGWEVHVATNLSDSTVEPDVATIQQIDMPRGANPLQLVKASRQLSALMEEIQPSVVHAHFSVGMLCLALAGRVKGVRYLGTFQGMRFPLASGLSSLLFKLVECFSILRLDQSWVLTADDFDAVPRYARKKLAIQEGYGFGCDIEHFDPARFSEFDNSKLRSTLGIPEDAFVFIFVGRLTEFKGFPLALAAFQRFRNECEYVHFVVVGEPDPQHPINLPDLNSLAGVHHVGWQEDPAPFLAIANSMVFPSEREGVPVCVIEGLSMSVSIIGLNVRGVSILVENGVNGFVCDRSVAALFDRMLRVDELRAMCPKQNPQMSREIFYQFVERSLD